jgi:hypothetical protein
VGHSFLKRSGTLGGNFVTEEDDLGCLEYALHRVDQDIRRTEVGILGVEDHQHSGCNAVEMMKVLLFYYYYFRSLQVSLIAPSRHTTFFWLP